MSGENAATLITGLGQPSAGAGGGDPAPSPDPGVPVGEGGAGSTPPAGAAGGQDAGSSGAPSGEWLKTLPADLQKELTPHGFKNVEALARSFSETKKLVGKSIQLKETGPDDSVYVKLGRPQDSTGYKYTQPDFGDRQIELGPAFESNARETAFRLGLNQKQFDQLVNAQAAQVETMARETRGMTNQFVSQLKEEWGPNFDRYLGVAQRAARHYNGEEGNLLEFLDKTGLGDHPVVVKMFYDMGKRLLEDGLIIADVGTATNAESAKYRIQEIRNDPDYFQRNPKGDLLREEMNRLYRMLYG